MARPSRTGGKTSEAKTRKASPLKGHKTTKTNHKIAAPATLRKRRSTSGRREQPDSYFEELKEAREQQAASAEILRVINSSKGDLTPVFDIILEKAHSLCDVPCGSLQLFDDDHTRAVAVRGMSEPFEQFLRQGYRLDRSQPVQSGRPFQIDDLTKVIVGASHGSALRVAFELGGLRTVLSVPLVRDGVVFGRILAGRQEMRPFSEHQIVVLQSFTDQAVIAIENVRLFNETREALERQTATADVLKVIASSPSNLQPVFDAIAERSKELIGGHSTTVIRYVGDMIQLGSFTPTNPEADAVLRALFPRPIADDAQTQGVGLGEIAQIVDTESESIHPEIRSLARARGWRSRLFVPLKDDNDVIGLISVTRKEPGSFADKDVELLRTFADQAVIAIQNVELFEEVKAKTRDLEESLQQQTATADVLKVISRSAFDLDAVMNTLASSARDLCASETASLFLREGDKLVCRGNAAVQWAHEQFVRANPVPLNDESHMGRAVLTGTIVNIGDFENNPHTKLRKFQQIMGFKSFLAVPLMREGRGVGVFTLSRDELGPFSERQVKLVQGFADQAVIAIENVRLFEEVQAKTRDLAESLQQQTATSEVLQIISSSPGDLAPVFDKMLENATRICGAEFGSMVLVEGDMFRSAALYNAPPAFAEARTDKVVQFHPRSSLADAIRSRQVVQTDDVRNSPGYLERNPSSIQLVELAGARTTVVVPMLREDEVIGAITVYRQEVRPFGEKQIELLTNFARQAVIAIENARLLRELRHRTDDLSEALVFQTGSSNILKVIASSPTDVAPALNAIAESACEICEAFDAVVFLKDGGDLVFSAHHGPIPIDLERWPINRKWITGRAVVDKAPQHLHDLLGPEGDDFPEARELARHQGQRTVLSVPLLQEGEAIGVISLRRIDVQPFNDKQIELLKSFADQAVIAISNVRLFEQVQERTRELSRSLDDLRTAQDRLIQTEKLASLGQLTAGIAHEIKNPLNFVNNFSALSAELTDELNDVLKPVAMDGKVRGEVDELTGLLKDNLEKVVQHGKRADSIVKNMLLHSREGSREHRPADINSLLDESLNLAYHGARAEKGEFNVTLQRDFDADAGAIELFPQEITRAFLNLIANGVYAATRRKTEEKELGFEPTLRATTKNLGTSVEIRIRDNGTGIPPEVQEKMFNPFFTTKPAGEGTGLGLSMTHDIIVKQHGGSIDVETEPGLFTEFKIVLPRSGQT